MIYPPLPGNACACTLILEYGAVIWDPPSLSVSTSLESVQHFALKLTSKNWSSNYHTLLTKYKLQTLQHRRKASKITTLFKLKFNYCHSLSSPLVSPSSPPSYFSRNFCSHNFVPIFSKTVSLSNLFYPSAIKLFMEFTS